MSYNSENLEVPEGNPEHYFYVTILACIAQMYKQGDLTHSQRGLLKHALFSDDEQLIRSCEDVPIDRMEEQLKRYAKHLVSNLPDTQSPPLIH